MRGRGVTILTGHRVVRAAGCGRVKAALIAPVGDVDLSTVRKIRCDLLCMSGPSQPVDALFHQADAYQPGVTLAGGVHGARGLHEINRQGWDAGARAASAAIGNSPSISAEAPLLDPATSTLPAVPPGKGARTYLCFCEDVSVHDIEQAIDEGFADVQTLKRYTTATMGPCQGKMCGGALAGICAAYAGPTTPFNFAGWAQRRRGFSSVHQSTRGGEQTRFPYRRPLHHFQAALPTGAAGGPGRDGSGCRSSGRRWTASTAI